jgi:tetratricopeptide (TPR) repeat protein
MAKKQKKTRKELLKEPDEFMTLSGKLIGFAVTYKTQLTYGLGIILALAIVFSGIRFFSIRAENKGAALLEGSLIEYNSLRTDKTPAAVYDAVSGGFQDILQKYGGKNSGKIARLIYANICYDAGKYEQAINLYNTSLKDFEAHPMIHSQILSSLGYAYEQQKQYSAAVGYFEKISTSPEQIQRGEALFHLGRLYNKLGQPGKSKEAYQKILSDHPDFIYIDIVKEQIAG